MLVPPILFVFPLIVHLLTHLSNLSLSPLYSGFYLFSKCFEESGTITWQTYVLWCLRSQTPWNASERLSVMSNLRQKMAYIALWLSRSLSLMDTNLHFSYWKWLFTRCVTRGERCWTEWGAGLVPGSDSIASPWSCSHAHALLRRMN